MAEDSWCCSTWPQKFIFGRLESLMAVASLFTDKSGNIKFHHILKVYITNVLTPVLLYQFSCSVVSNSLQPHEPQHTRPPCPSPTPGVHPNPCPPTRWCHPTISSSVIPFSSWPQSFPESGSFPISWLFASSGQNIGASALASVLEYSVLISFRFLEVLYYGLNCPPLICWSMNPQYDHIWGWGPLGGKI